MALQSTRKLWSERLTVNSLPENLLPRFVRSVPQHGNRGAPRALSINLAALGSDTALSEPKGSVLHQQALTVMDFFTGLILTSLVLILTAPGAFHAPIGPLSGQQYFETVTTFVAIVGALSSVAMITFLEVAGGMAQPYSFVDKLGTTLLFLSVFGFMGILPLLLVGFTKWGAAIVRALEVVLLLVYFVGRRTLGSNGAGSCPRWVEGALGCTPGYTLSEQ
jgi:hypothetical protein